MVATAVCQSYTGIFQLEQEESSGSGGVPHTGLRRVSAETSRIFRGECQGLAGSAAAGRVRARVALKAGRRSAASQLDGHGVKGPMGKQFVPLRSRSSNDGCQAILQGVSVCAGEASSLVRGIRGFTLGRRGRSGIEGGRWNAAANAKTQRDRYRL